MAGIINMDTGLIILGEAGLSLYPLLIKLVDTNLITQLVIRFLSYTVLAYMGSYIFDNKLVTYNLLEYIYLGIMNILHVLASYSAFEILSSGTGYTLFYLYPVFNLIGRNFFYNENVKWYNYFYIILAIGGVYLLTQKQSNDKYLQENSPDYDFYLGMGVGSGLLSAITESVMYLLIKSESRVSAFQQTTRFYSLGGLVSLLLIAKSWLSSRTSHDNVSEKQNVFFGSLEIQYNWQQMLELILFNSLIGFIGYVIIYFTIPRTTTMQFNTLVFIGIIFSYIWGYVLNGESVPWQNAIGSVLIMLSIVMVNS
jgi:drug/metabolite transporter (DMT)-like permease